jgi:hypothetical protein
VAKNLRGGAIHTLRSVLDIVLEQLTAEERAAWPEEEKLYAQLHSPLDEPYLTQAIEAIQASFRKRGLRYARILMRRKIEIREGRFVPQRPQPEPTSISVAIVQCIHCGAAFRSVRLFEHPRAHPCSQLDRNLWHDMKEAGLAGPKKAAVLAARAQEKKEA